MADRTSSSRRAKPGDDAIGQFIIDQEIGKGSFAQVYSSRHKVGTAVAPLDIAPWVTFLFHCRSPVSSSPLNLLNSPVLIRG